MGNSAIADIETKLIFQISGLTQKGTKVGLIHELPLRKNKVFSHILRKS
jgi:hypothetical protein